MIVGPEHVGKSVDRGNGPVLVTGIGRERFLGEFAPNSGEGTFDREGEWRVVEPTRKPSQRIRELVSDNKGPIAAIIDYLDEQFEKTGGKSERS